MIGDLGTIAGNASHSKAINDRGQVVGSAETKQKDEEGNLISHIA